MLAVCPVIGMTTSPACGMWRFMNSPGSRHGSSWSPTTISDGTVSVFSSGSSSKIVFRFICTPRIMSAEPTPEWSSTLRRNSCHPRGSFSAKPLREGVSAKLRCLATTPSRS